MKTNKTKAPEAPAVKPLEWNPRARKTESDITMRSIVDSTCGRYQLCEVTFKVTGMRRIWQAFGPTWAGHTRIVSKIYEGRNRDAAIAAANQHYQQFMESEAAQ